MMLQLVPWLILCFNVIAVMLCWAIYVSVNRRAAERGDAVKVDAEARAVFMRSDEERALRVLYKGLVLPVNNICQAFPDRAVAECVAAKRRLEEIKAADAEDSLVPIYVYDCLEKLIADFEKEIPDYSRLDELPSLRLRVLRRMFEDLSGSACRIAVAQIRTLAQDRL